MKKKYKYVIDEKQKTHKKNKKERTKLKISHTFVGHQICQQLTNNTKKKYYQKERRFCCY
jgi:hypothetical protein